MLKDVKSADINNKIVLCRVDYNVPLEAGLVKDTTRIERSLETVRYLLDKASQVILCSHLGRPKGKVVPELSLKPVALKLEEILGEKVYFIDTTDQQLVKQTIEENNSNKLFMLENTRFNPGEKKNSDEYSGFLASLADVFVSDAFGAAHRAHASTEGITRFIPGYAGFLIKNEYDKITTAIKNPEEPSMAIFGGAKISTKLDVLEYFIDKVNIIVLGGGMANTFLKAQGKNIGNSLYEEEMIDAALRIMDKSKEYNVEILTPQDVRIGESLENPIIENGVARVVRVDDIPENGMILDIGPKTVANYIDKVIEAKTILWNGPMGVFEKELYREGTLLLAKGISERSVKTVIGGGETAYAMNMLDQELPPAIHVSTGGGASLELMAGKTLPGLSCLKGEKLEK